MGVWSLKRMFSLVVRNAPSGAESVVGGGDGEGSGSNPVEDAVHGLRDFRFRKQETELLVRKLEKVDPLEAHLPPQPVVTAAFADVHRVRAGTNLLKSIQLMSLKQMSQGSGWQAREKVM